MMRRVAPVALLLLVAIWRSRQYPNGPCRRRGRWRHRDRLDAGRQQHRIRLGGIDAPEKAQPFGEKSKQNLSRLVFGKDVRVEWEKRDRYERIVGKVWVQPESARPAR